ncbi:Hypothetical protein R9X50_00051400 [Acrodontium crateriforme]|uniref:Uncharacterized protein n=1 Tax=Acrodontium crateriforme TaxID=150365 RepID=A0AAQ3R4Z3_9PEZI|nr:Hypothetical protein R9X50_00051400 [Acrodontium crateriforme]
MFYLMYLSNICQRRSWPEPMYEHYQTSHGHFCKVRVNNREYCTDVPYETDTLAKDGAAMRAYMIVRNFSHNDGMYPGQRPGHRSSNGIVQGLPVAIGTGRRSNRSSGASYETVSSSSDGGTSSGGNSPKSLESGFEQQLRQVTQQTPRATPQTMKSRGEEQYMCYCRRGPVRSYGRCGWCLRENGWA